MPQTENISFRAWKLSIKARFRQARHVMGLAIEPARQGLIYVLEFYISRVSGSKTSLEKFTVEEGTLDDARAQAKSIMRNVKFDGAMANLCIVRAKGGAIVCEVKPDERRL
jgi:hypothetical protein